MVYNYKLHNVRMRVHSGALCILFPAHIAAYFRSARIFFWFLLGTGRMPHPVGGAMGVTLRHRRERSLNLIKYS